jgi:hypothetical protein
MQAFHIAVILFCLQAHPEGLWAGQFYYIIHKNIALHI